MECTTLELNVGIRVVFWVVLLYFNNVYIHLCPKFGFVKVGLL